MSLKPLLSWALAATTLGACSGVHLQSEIAPSTYDYQNFTLYHAERDTLVEVQGNPFNMDAGVFAKAVTDHMQGGNFGRPTNFTTTPGASAEPNMRVVMAFNTSADSEALCTANYRPQTAGAAVSLKAAWCLENRVDSWVDATLAGVTSTQDPKFHDLIDEVVMNLFPPQMDTETIRDNGDDVPK
jgi:hypothetical protein